MGNFAPDRLIWMASSDLRPANHQRSSCRRLHPFLFNLEELSSYLTAPGRLHIRLKSDPIGCFSFSSAGEADLIDYLLVVIGPSRPLSSRSAREHLAARSRLCVTRIEVSP